MGKLRGVGIREGMPGLPRGELGDLDLWRLVGCGEGAEAWAGADRPSIDTADSMTTWGLGGRIATRKCLGRNELKRIIFRRRWGRGEGGVVLHFW